MGVVFLAPAKDASTLPRKRQFRHKIRAEYRANFNLGLTVI